MSMASLVDALGKVRKHKEVVPVRTSSPCTRCLIGTVVFWARRSKELAVYRCISCAATQDHPHPEPLN